MEIEGFVVIFVLAALGGMAYVAYRQHRPPVDARYFRIAQAAVRVLDKLRSDYTVSPMIDPKDRLEIDRVVDEFYR